MVGSRVGLAAVVAAAVSGACVVLPASAAEPGNGDNLNGKTVYLAPGGALRGGPNLTDKIILRADKWLALKGRDVCTRWNCLVDYEGQVAYARRSRLDYDDKTKTASGGSSGSSGAGAGSGSGSGSGAAAGGSGGSAGSQVPGNGINRKLVRGDEGDDVKLVQEALVRRGYKVAVDGKYGSGTEEAVQQFQGSQGLSTDGRVGPLTWAKLR